MILEEHLVLKETDLRDYHSQRHAGTGQIIRFKPGKRIVSYFSLFKTQKLFFHRSYL